MRRFLALALLAAQGWAGACSPVIPFTAWLNYESRISEFYEGKQEVVHEFPCSQARLRASEPAQRTCYKSDRDIAALFKEEGRPADFKDENLLKPGISLKSVDDWRGEDIVILPYGRGGFIAVTRWQPVSLRITETFNNRLIFSNPSDVELNEECARVLKSTIQDARIKSCGFERRQIGYYEPLFFKFSLYSSRDRSLVANTVYALPFSSTCGDFYPIPYEVFIRDYK